MAPFTKRQLVIAEIDNDTSLAATHIKLYGVRHGAADFLVVDHQTFVLESDAAGSANRCWSLGDIGWRPLPRDWLTPQSRCVGTAPIGQTPVDWWKTPVQPSPSSYWVWYDDTGSAPFRLIFETPSDRLSVLSHYALSYRTSFEPGSADLAGIVASCRHAEPSKTGGGANGLRAQIDAMETSELRAEAEIARLMPALDARCPATELPHWPDQLAITGLMTPFDSQEDPAPTEVLYDWSTPGMRTRVFPPSGPIAAQDAMLVGPQGYTVTHRRSGAPSCTAGLPGTLRPDWPGRAPCSCEAAIKGTTPLTPRGTTRIMACPLNGPRTAWAWYALDGTPLVFMVTAAKGDEGSGSFAALDYRDWLPGMRLAHSALDLPPYCEARQTRRPRGLSAGPAPRSQCSTCHLGPPVSH